MCTATETGTDTGRVSGLHPRQEGEQSRIQALTGGVFAIAVTILVLGLTPPRLPTRRSLAHCATWRRSCSSTS